MVGGCLGAFIITQRTSHKVTILPHEYVYLLQLSLVNWILLGRGEDRLLAVAQGCKEKDH